jgi:hypothetical protein
VSKPDPNRIATTWVNAQRGHSRIAGEVIFKKDRSNDANQWAFADQPPSRRELTGDFNYSPKNMKPLATVLRATLAALGHTLSAYNQFAKIKSAKISPDGSLGGRGYIQKIQDMRRQYMNCVEALSALSDTLYDETTAPHWAVLSRQQDEKEEKQIVELIQDSEQIREDPQEWAEAQLSVQFDDDSWLEDDEEDLAGTRIFTKSASQIRLEVRTGQVALRWLERQDS